MPAVIVGFSVAFGLKLRLGHGVKLSGKRKLPARPRVIGQLDGHQASPTPPSSNEPRRMRLIAVARFGLATITCTVSILFMHSGA